MLLLNANRVGVGTYHRALHFGRELARRGHEVTMMTVSGPSDFDAHTVRDSERFTVIECPNWLDEMLPWHASGAIDIALRIRELWRGDYDVVYAFEYQPNISIPVLLARRFKPIHVDLGLVRLACRRLVPLRRLSARARDRSPASRSTSAIAPISSRRSTRRCEIALARSGSRTTASRSSVKVSTRATSCRAIRPQHGANSDFPGVKLVGTIRDADRSARDAVRGGRRIRGTALPARGRSNPDIRASGRVGVAERVITPGRVSDDDLPRYLAAATCWRCRSKTTSSTAGAGRTSSAT